MYSEYNYIGQKQECGILMFFLTTVSRFSIKFRKLMNPKPINYNECYIENRK